MTLTGILRGTLKGIFEGTPKEIPQEPIQEPSKGILKGTSKEIPKATFQASFLHQAERLLERARRELWAEASASQRGCGLGVWGF